MHLIVWLIVRHAVWVSWGLTRGHPCATMGNHRPHPTRQGVEKELFAFVFYPILHKSNWKAAATTAPTEEGQEKAAEEKAKTVVKPLSGIWPFDRANIIDLLFLVQFPILPTRMLALLLQRRVQMQKQKPARARCVVNFVNQSHTSSIGSSLSV